MVQKSSDSYVLLSDTSTDDEALSIKSTETKVVLQSYITALGGGANCAEGYEYLYDALDTAFDVSSEDCFCEALLLETQGEIYGAINFYNRPSGRSGSLLTNENIVKGIYLSITDGEVNIVKESDDTAILAFNQTHLIVYRDKAVYSVDINSGEEVFLFKDKWWDRGPTYYNNFKVSFTDESFLIYAQADNGTACKETIMSGNLDGTDFTVLIDNRKIEY